MVAGDFRKFVQIVHGALPDTWIYILSIKPSNLRLKQWPAMKRQTSSCRITRRRSSEKYIDIATSTFDANGNLPADLFKPDRLHPTAKLYAMWTATIKPILPSDSPDKSSSRQIFRCLLCCKEQKPER